MKNAICYFFSFLVEAINYTLAIFLQSVFCQTQTLGKTYRTMLLIFYPVFLFAV